MIKKLFLMAGAAVAGIYLTSEEGKNARKALLEKKSAVEPIIKDLLSQANSILEGNSEVNSDNIRHNIDLLVKEAKDSLINLELDSVTETITSAIRVTAKKLSSLENDVIKTRRAEDKMKSSPVSSKAKIKEVEEKLANATKGKKK